jgi:phosphoglycerol transferase
MEWTEMLVRLISTAGLLIIFGYAVMVASLPRFRPDQIAPYMLLILIAAVIFGRRHFRWPPRSFLLVVLAAIALVPAAVVARAFGRVDMMSVLFHADFGMEGATLKGLETEILQGVLAGTLISVTLALLVGMWRLRLRSVAVLACVVLAINPAMRFAAVAAVTPTVESDLVSRMVAPVMAADATQTPDLLLIYLEGVDRQFADPAVWDDLYQPLQELEAEGTSFTRVGQIAGTGWSLAGMVATQCGVPVVPKGLLYRNNFEDIARFMPQVTCLGDVLADKGYAQSYVVGGDTKFGGISAFYATHQITRQIGLNEQKDLYPPAEFQAALASWVVDDQMTLQTAQAEFETLVAGPGAFALTVETIAPHGRMGILSRRCNDGKTVTLSRDVRAVVGCLLEDTLRFVRAAQEMHATARPGRDLFILILSDHLNHNPGLPSVDAEFQGNNTAILIGPGVAAGAVNTKVGAMIDVYPMLLQAMGLSVPPYAANLGRSLLHSGTTVTEDHGIPTFDSMLVSDVVLSKLIWAEAP